MGAAQSISSCDESAPEMAASTEAKQTRLIWELVKSLEVDIDLFCEKAPDANRGDVLGGWDASEELTSTMLEFAKKCYRLKSELALLYSVKSSGFTQLEVCQIILKVLTLLSATVRIDATPDNLTGRNGVYKKHDTGVQTEIDDAEYENKISKRYHYKRQERNVTIYFENMGCILGRTFSKEEKQDSMLTILSDGTRVIGTIVDNSKRNIIKDNSTSICDERQFALPPSAREALLSVALLLLGQKKVLRSVSNACHVSKKQHKQHQQDESNRWMLIINWYSLLHVLLRTAPNLDKQRVDTLPMNFLSHQSPLIKKTVKLVSSSTKFFDQGIRPPCWIGDDPIADATARELWNFLKGDLLGHTHKNSRFRALVLLYLFHPSNCSSSFYLEVLPLWMESWKSVDPTPEFDFLWVVVHCRARRYVRQNDYDWREVRKQLDHVEKANSSRWDDSHSETSSLTNSLSAHGSLSSSMVVDFIDPEHCKRGGKFSSNITDSFAEGYLGDVDLSKDQGTVQVVKKSKLSNRSSQYFNQKYRPTKAEIDEMTVIQQDLLSDGENKDELHIIIQMEEDESMNVTAICAIKSIFFPSGSQPRSVFLKSGPVHVYNPDECNDQCDLMMFSRGFLFSRILQSAPQLSKLQKAQRSLRQLTPLHLTNNNDGNKKLHSAYLFSDIDRVETLDVWKYKEIKRHLNGDDKIALSGTAFAIFTCHEISPVIVLCPSKEEVDQWVDAFRICISGQKSAVFGKNRSTVQRAGVVFGINNTRRSRNTISRFQFSSLNWDDDDDW